MSTAVRLRSVPVTVQVGLALRTGSRDDPQPQPISMKCCGGSLMVRQGNSSSRNRNSRSAEVMDSLAVRQGRAHVDEGLIAQLQGRPAAIMP
ncbi:MAG: hypothetical protein FRX49_04413 [Trebouxia sp. A1-2]|nr:MAG: hypothetical protein FRX49_04413 [Trebouxia sp. A1-2]